jgi:hypothetical protein
MIGQIKPESILKGPFWPENVRVISVKTISENQIKIEAVGLETQRFYNPILSIEKINKTEIFEEKPLKPEEEISIVRYVVKNWKEKAAIAQ